MKSIEQRLFAEFNTKSAFTITEDELWELWNNYVWEPKYIMALGKYEKIPYDEFLQKVKDKTITMFGKPLVLK